MNDTDLYNKAAKAGYDYRTVHGSFPEKIGIHYERLRQFHRDCIIFPEPTPLEVNWFKLEEEIPPYPTLKQHHARFEPVVGKSIQWDEVYLPVPGSEQETISGEEIASQARELEREKRARILLGRSRPSDWVGMGPVIHRKEQE